MNSNITLKQGCKYALLVPTSMGLRVTPAAGQPVECSDVLNVQATSAETNVASIASYLGLPVKVLTTFVEGSPFSQFIKRNLRSRGMDFEGPDVPQGGPWGYRHQINVADSGYGSRGPRVGSEGRAVRIGGDADLAGNAVEDDKVFRFDFEPEARLPDHGTERLAGDGVLQPEALGLQIGMGR